MPSDNHPHNRVPSPCKGEGQGEGEWSRDTACATRLEDPALPMLHCDSGCWAAQMRTWFVVFICIFLALPAAVLGDEIPHLGIPIGTGWEDQSGDSRYSTIHWCGEHLFLQTDEGPQLIEPATRTVVPRDYPQSVMEHPLHASLIDCTKSGRETILWFDTGDAAVVWQALSGSQSGVIHGFSRADSVWDYPLLDFTDTMVVGIAAEGQAIEATALPKDMKLASIPRNAVQRFVRGGRLIGTTLLSPTLIELDSRDESADDFISVLDVDLAGPLSVVKDGVILQDTVSGEIDELVRPKVRDRQVVFKVTSEEGVQECGLGAITSAARAICTPSSYDKTFAERLAERLAPNWAAWDYSESWKWVAWAEWADQTNGPVRFYLAPTTDLLKP